MNWVIQATKHVYESSRHRYRSAGRGDGDLELAAGGTIKARAIDYRLDPGVQKLWLDHRTVGACASGRAWESFLQVPG
jgi:hypothetical protein